MKKNIKFFLQVVIIISILGFWLLVFFMSDTNSKWCKFSFGNYEAIKYCDSNQCAEPKDDYLCINGIFDLTGKKSKKLIKSMEDYKNIYPVYIKEENKRFKTMEDADNYMLKKIPHATN